MVSGPSERLMPSSLACCIATPSFSNGPSTVTRAGRRVSPRVRASTSTVSARLSCTSRRRFAFSISRSSMILASATESRLARSSSDPACTSSAMPVQPLPSSWAATRARSAGSLMSLSAWTVFRKVSLTSTAPSEVRTISMPSFSNSLEPLAISRFIRLIDASTTPDSMPMSPATSTQRDASSAARPVTSLNLSTSRARSRKSPIALAANVAMAAPAPRAMAPALALMASNATLEPARSLPIAPSASPILVLNWLKAPCADLRPASENSVMMGMLIAIRRSDRCS